jgi:hypothetical protein
MSARGMGLAGIVALVLLASGASGQDHLASAKDMFRRGSELYAAGRTSDAVDAFRASLALYSSPNTRLLLARSYRRLERYADAALEYERTLRDAEDTSRSDGHYAAAASAARAELASLEARIGRVELVFHGDPRGAKVTFDSREIEGEPLRHPIPSMPGRVEIVLTQASNQVRATAVVNAGETTTVLFELGERAPEPAAHRLRPVPAVAPAPAPTPALLPPAPVDPPRAVTSPAPPWLAPAMWASFGVGIASAAAFGSLFAATDAKYTELVRSCVEASCSDARYQELRHGGETLQTATNVTLVLSAVALTAGATLFYFGRAHAARVTVGAGRATIEGTW